MGILSFLHLRKPEAPKESIAFIPYLNDMRFSAMYRECFKTWTWTPRANRLNGKVRLMLGYLPPTGGPMVDLLVITGLSSGDWYFQCLEGLNEKFYDVELQALRLHAGELTAKFLGSVCMLTEPRLKDFIDTYNRLGSSLYMEEMT